VRPLGAPPPAVSVKPRPLPLALAPPPRSLPSDGDTRRAEDRLERPTHRCAGADGGGREGMWRGPSTYVWRSRADPGEAGRSWADPGGDFLDPVGGVPGASGRSRAEGKSWLEP